MLWMQRKLLVASYYDVHSTGRASIPGKKCPSCGFNTKGGPMLSIMSFCKVIFV